MVSHGFEGAPPYSRGAVYNFDSKAVSGEEHGMEINHAGVLSSGDSLVGLNIVVTPTGTEATWSAGAYIKHVEGDTKVVSGYACALELELVRGAYTGQSHYGILVLNSSLSCATISEGAYILIREYGASSDCYTQNFVRFYDITPATTDGTKLFTTSAGKSHSHSLRFMVGSTPYWFMVTSTPG